MAKRNSLRIELSENKTMPEVISPEDNRFLKWTKHYSRTRSNQVEPSNKVQRDQFDDEKVSKQNFKSKVNAQTRFQLSLKHFFGVFFGILAFAGVILIIIGAVGNLFLK